MGRWLPAGVSRYHYATWDYRIYYGLPESAGRISLVRVIAAGFVALLMLANGLLARWRLRRSER